MESITSVKIFHGSEYKANGKVIRWTEVGLWVCQPSSGAGTAAPPVTTGKQCMLPLEPVVPLLPAQGAAGWDPVGYKTSSHSHSHTAPATTAHIMGGLPHPLLCYTQEQLVSFAFVLKAAFLHGDKS